MGSLEVSPAADVLVYEVVDESARTRAQLHYFLVDGTAAVFGGGGRAPTAFRLGAGPGDRAPLFAAGAGRRRLGPVDLAVGARAVAAGDGGSSRATGRRANTTGASATASASAAPGRARRRGDARPLTATTAGERIRACCFPRYATVESRPRRARVRPAACDGRRPAVRRRPGRRRARRRDVRRPHAPPDVAGRRRTVAPRRHRGAGVRAPAAAHGRRGRRVPGALTTAVPRRRRAWRDDGTPRSSMAP